MITEKNLEAISILMVLLFIGTISVMVFVLIKNIVVYYRYKKVDEYKKLKSFIETVRAYVEQADGGICTAINFFENHYIDNNILSKSEFYSFSKYVESRLPECSFDKTGYSWPFFGIPSEERIKYRTDFLDNLAAEIDVKINKIIGD